MYCFGALYLLQNPLLCEHEDARAGETALWAKHMLCKHEDPHSDSKTPHKGIDTDVCVCVEPQGLGLGGWAEMHKSQGVSLWWANLADTGSSRSERDPDLDSKVGKMGQLRLQRSMVSWHP